MISTNNKGIYEYCKIYKPWDQTVEKNDSEKFIYNKYFWNKSSNYEINLCRDEQLKYKQIQKKKTCLKIFKYQNIDSTLVI